MEKPQGDANVVLSVRISQEERDVLRREAGDRGVSAHVRGRLFPESTKTATRRVPSGRTKDYARVLAQLGSSELAPLLREIMHLARSGSLEMSAETVQALESACRSIEEMRDLLIRALRLRGHGL